MGLKARVWPWLAHARCVPQSMSRGWMSGASSECKRPLACASCVASAATADAGSLFQAAAAAAATTTTATPFHAYRLLSSAVTLRHGRRSLPTATLAPVRCHPFSSGALGSIQHQIPPKATPLHVVNFASDAAMPALDAPAHSAPQPPPSPSPQHPFSHSRPLPFTSVASTLANQSNAAMKTLRFNSRGEPSLAEVTKTDLTSQLRLQARDLRTLDLRQQQSTILARSHAIIINVLHLKAIIRADSVLLFNHTEPEVEEFVFSLQERLKASSATAVYADPLPYEFKVLEEILVNVCSSLTAKLSAIRPVVFQVLANLTETEKAELDKQQLMILLHYSKRLTGFEREVEDVKHAINELLNSDEDMACMYLTTKAQTGHSRRIDQHEEVELLLENYLKEVEEIATEVAQMKSFMKDTEDIINITLDSQRNTIMRMELQLTMATFATALCGLGAASFGMNLQSSLETHPHAFWIVSGSLFAGTFVVWNLLMRMGRKRKIW